MWTLRRCVCVDSPLERGESGKWSLGHFQQWLLNMFKSGISEPGRYHMFLPVLSGTIVITDVCYQRLAEYDRPTSVYTSGQGKSAMSLSQLGSNFYSSEPMYCWLKCSERFNVRSTKWIRTSSMLKGMALPHQTGKPCAHGPGFMGALSCRTGCCRDIRLHGLRF